MASIHQEIPVNASVEDVWSAIRDFGAVHLRLAPGFVIDTMLENDARIVTFANGMVARELLVDLNDEERRLAYAVVGDRVTHHNASIQVFAEGAGRSRIFWRTDVLPNEAAKSIGAMMEQGARVMKQTLEKQADS